MRVVSDLDSTEVMKWLIMPRIVGMLKLKLHMDGLKLLATLIVHAMIYPDMPRELRLNWWLLDN